MNKYKYSLLLSLLCCSFLEPTFAQTVDYRKLDYTEIDNYVDSLKHKRFRRTSDLALALTSRYDKDYEKVRAIFSWITQNIDYDYKDFFDEEHLERKIRHIRPQKVLRRRKAICAGYARLFESMCNTAKIKSQTISGYSRQEEKDIGRRSLTVNHAWNAVSINNQWYLLDATWATGSTISGMKWYNKQYYLTPPEQLILDHLPKNKMWQLLKDPIDLKQFQNYPAVYDDFFSSVAEFYPKDGVLRAEIYCPVTLKFKLLDKQPIKSFDIRIQNQKIQPTIESSTIDENGLYAYTFSMPRKGAYLIEVWINGYQTFTYRLIVK